MNNGLGKIRWVRLSLIQHELGEIMWKKIFISILLFGVFNISNVIAHDFKLEIITEDWAPYNYVEDNIVIGFSVEIVQAIMEELGEKHEIKVYPGARGEMMLDSMPNIMNFSLLRTPERETKYKWIGPISEEAIYFYKRKDDPREFKTLDDIKRVKTITVPHKGLVKSYVDAQGITNINALTTREAQFLHLFMGRADLSINASQIGVAYYLKKLNKPPDALVRTQVKLLEFPLYIACSKGIPDRVIKKWQRALDKIKSSGRYKQIYNKYLQ